LSRQAPHHLKLLHPNLKHGLSLSEPKRWYNLHSRRLLPAHP
jgi:hypothetical protein